MRTGQLSGRATVALLAKPEVWMPVAFTATFCTIPLHMAYFTYPAFHESFGFFFFLGTCVSSSKRYIQPHKVTSLAHLEPGDFLEISLLSFVRVIAVLFFQNSGIKSGVFFAYAAEFLMVLICHILSLFRFWQQPVLN